MRTLTRNLLYLTRRGRGYHPPPANTSREAVRLRELAQAFGKPAPTGFDSPLNDSGDRDREGERANTELLNAARAYAKAAEAAELIEAWSPRRPRPRRARR